MNALVSLRGLSAGYRGASVIHDINLDISRSELVGVVGPSGSGKTTLLKVILGSVTPLGGTAKRGDGCRVGYVPQVQSIDWNFPVTVSDVVLMTRTDRRWPRTTPGERELVESVLEKLGLSGLSHRQIRELSGGQQQRVFVARALAADPDLLVLDEPTSGVDVRTRHDVMHLLDDLRADGTAIVLTTHDLNEVAAHLPRIVCLNRTVIADGKPAAVLTSEVLEITYGAPMDVLEHGGMPLVTDRRAEPTWT